MGTPGWLYWPPKFPERRRKEISDKERKGNINEKRSQGNEGEERNGDLEEGQDSSLFLGGIEVSIEAKQKAMNNFIRIILCNHLVVSQRLGQDGGVLPDQGHKFFIALSNSGGKSKVFKVEIAEGGGEEIVPRPLIRTWSTG